MITCTFEDGGAGKLRHVTANALVVQDNKVLLGKRGTYDGGKPLQESGKWGMIGGFMGRDESIEQALRREIREESGWEVDNLRLLHVKDNPDRAAEDRQNIEFVYVADAVSNIPVIDEEVQELKWFALDELPPRDQIAFDHADDLELYKEYITKKISLPVIGKYKT